MYRPTVPQPAATLISTALSEYGVYASLRRPRNFSGNVAVNNCSDNRTIYNKISRIKQELKLENEPVPVNCFGGLIRLSRHCPGYKLADARFILNEFRTAVIKLDVRILYGGAHGEECAWCSQEGVTVAQRHWLSCDAKQVVLRTAELDQWSKDPLNVCVTWHRRYQRDGHERQRTRVIGCRHPLFTALSISRVMAMTDMQMIERISPHLLNLATV